MKSILLLILMSSLYVNSAYAEKSLMRLFYSPGERALIDLNRNAVKKTKVSKKAAPQEQTDRIELKGYLKRTDKPDVVWVNSKNTLKSNKPLSDVRVIRVQAGGKVALKVRGKGTVKLKPGQVITRQQKSIKEVYE